MTRIFTMTTVVERKFVNLRKRLDQLGYRQPLGVESLPLVEKLFSDLVHTTESLRSTKLSAGKIEKECSNFDVVLEPYREENARLTRENNELHLEVLKLKEQLEEQVKNLKATLRKFEHENSDMKFLNNQYIHKMRSLEKENKAKTDKIQQLQEKNLQAVVQTPGGKKRNIPFRRQRMQIDQPVPPSGIGTYPVPQPNDPYIADLLQVADNRIHELQIEVDDLQEKLEIAEREMKNYSKQVELRDNEIERLAVALDGGRSHDVISLEAKSRSNEKIIDHLNLQVEFLQQTKKDLEKRIEDLLDSRQNMTSEVAHLSNKNEELCQELTEIDHLAQQLERHKEIVLETADKEIGEAKVWEFLCSIYWTGSSDFPGIYWSHSPSLGVTALSAPTTTGKTLAFLSTSSLVLPSGPGTSPVSCISPNCYSCHCYIHIHCCVLVLVCYHFVCLNVKYLLACLDLEVLQELSHVIFCNLLWNFLSGLGKVYFNCVRPIFTGGVRLKETLWGRAFVGNKH